MIKAENNIVLQLFTSYKEEIYLKFCKQKDREIQKCIMIIILPIPTKFNDSFKPFKLSSSSRASLFINEDRKS